MNKTNFTSSIISQGITEVRAGINIHKFLECGMTASQSVIKIKDIPGLCQKMRRDGMSVYDYSRYVTEIIIESNNICVVIWAITKQMCVYGKSHEHIVKFLNEYSDFIEEYDDDSININYFYLDSGSVCNDYVSLPVSKLPNVIPELYPDIDANKLSAEFKLAEEPILMLCGKPGVGKTTYLKHLLKTGDYRKIAYVKDMTVVQTSDFWGQVSTTPYDMLIFDDLDFALGPRAEAQGDTLVGNLLSYSDGLFNYNRAKVVITTNQGIESIDSALVRPGRCFDFLVLNELTFDQAAEIWVDTLDMPLEQFNEIYKGKEKVMQAAIMSDYRRIKALNMERSYVKKGTRRYTVEDKLKEMQVEMRDTKRGVGF